jgi:hypothetical protein
MQVLDLIGIFAFAVSGALTAIRRDFDRVSSDARAPHAAMQDSHLAPAIKRAT